MQQTVDEAVAGYIQFQGSMNYSPATIKNTRAVLHQLVRHAGPRKLSGVTPTTITEFMLKQAKTRTGSSMVHTHDRLCVFFKWCVESGYIKPQNNPMRGRRSPKFVKTERQRLHYSKFPLLLALAEKQDPRDRAICATAIYTMMRDQEMATLRVRDLDLAAGYISAVIHKSNKEDRVPICAELDTELRAWLVRYQDICGALRPDWYLFPFMVRDQGRSARGRLGASTFQTYDPLRHLGQTGRFITPLLGEVGMVLVREDGTSNREGAHTLRRSGARGLYDVLVARGRVDALRIVQTMLHHADVQQTQLYIGLDPDRVVRDTLIRGEVLYGFDELPQIGDVDGTGVGDASDVRRVRSA